MFVVVIVVDRVPATVVDVVDVVAVRDGHVAAALAVLVSVGLVYGVLAAGLAFVEVSVVGLVQVPVVDIVDVIGVRDGHVAAALTVGVGVTFMLYVCCGHRLILALVHVCIRSFLE